MNVEAIPHEKFTFRVESESKPGHWHVVGWLDDPRAPVCTCRDYQTRRRPAVDRGEPLFTASTCCKHIQAVNRHLLLSIHQKLIK